MFPRGTLITLIAACVLCTGFPSYAQFRDPAFTQNYNDKNTADTLGRDTSDVMFSFKELFGGLRHKQRARIGVVFGGSTVLVGGQQIYNREYWKLPVIYGGLAGSATAGFVLRNKWKHTGESRYRDWSNVCFAGAGTVYWATLMDGVTGYERDVPNQAGKATLYSLLLPGLGQAYNGEYWKIPVYYSGIITSGYFFLTNRKNYRRYRWIYNMATTEDSGYDGPIGASQALYYRNVFRRYRDYSVVAIAGFYLLQVIDANVFSYMKDFELSDDISMKISPEVYQPGEAYAFGGPSGGVGLKIGLTF